jgi:hypothetical protein
MEDSGLSKKQLPAAFQHMRPWFSISCLLLILSSPLIRSAWPLRPICLLLEEPDKILIYSLRISYHHHTAIPGKCEQYYARDIIWSGTVPGWRRVGI